MIFWLNFLLIVYLIYKLQIYTKNNDNLLVIRDLLYMNILNYLYIYYPYLLIIRYKILQNKLSIDIYVYIYNKYISFVTLKHYFVIF